MGRGARTKGYIKNLNTGKINKFLYNPEQFSTSRNVNYSEISAPGSSYPVFQYVGGEVKTITFDLFLYGNKDEVRTQIKFLEGFMPEEKSKTLFKRPPLMLFAFGSYIKTCILEGYSEEFGLFHSDLRPRIAIIRLSLKVVA